MRNLINTRIYSLSLVTALIISSISQGILANDKNLNVLSNSKEENVALNRKPAYFRKKVNVERKKSKQSIKAYTLNSSSNINTKVLSKNRINTCTGMHPDVTKRYRKHC